MRLDRLLGSLGIASRSGARDMIHRAHARVEELTADYRSLQPVITGEQFEKLERQAAQAAQAILS